MMRSALIAVLALVALPAAAGPCAGFTDVDDTSPFCANVAWLKNRNITLGCGAGLFCPNNAVTRLSMAVFLNRLGDTVLPPNVIWVAPVGGQFQSLQGAIDYAAPLATAQVPFVIKVAPGTFAETIKLANNVRIEGSGKASTRLQPAVCASPKSSAVEMAPVSEIHDVTIDAGPCHTAILFDGGVSLNVSFQGSTVRDVDIVMVGGPGPATGIGVTGSVSAVGPIERVGMNVQRGLHNYGVFADAINVQLTLADVEMQIAGGTGSTGLRLQGSTAILSRMTINASGPGGPNLFGIDADGPASVLMRDSISGGVGTQIRTTSPASVLVVNTGMINNTVTGPNIVCLYSYGLTTKAALTC